MKIGNTFGFIVVACLGLMVNQASAQQIAICGVGQMDNNWIESLEMEKKSEINLHIDYINRVCELDDKQLSKLNIAAKMVVGRIIEKAKKQQQGMIEPAVPVPAGVDGEGGLIEIEERPEETGELPLEADEDAEVENAVQDLDAPAAAAAPAVQLIAPVQIAVNGPGMNQFTDEEFIYGKSLAYYPVWNQKVEKILTESQREALAKAEKERYLQTHQSVIDRSAIRLSNILFLNNEQVDQIRELCNKKLENHIKTEFSGMGQVYDFDGMLYSTTTAKDVAEILTEAQLERWKVITRHWQVAVDE